MRIYSTIAYRVNLMDKQGDRLMSEDQVNELIDNKLGAIVDDLLKGMGMFLPREKLQLHSDLKAALPALAAIHDMILKFNEAQQVDHL